MLLDWALKYRRMGLSVFPVNGKVPLIKWKEFQERLPSEEEIKSWWERWPEADIGMVTGAITGRLVLDIDGPEGEESIRGSVLPLTGSVRTRRGYQYHFKYAGALDKSTVVGIRPGVDVRGLGGYVKLPPSSTSDGGRYTWLRGRGIDEVELAAAPQWLIDALVKPVIKPQEYGKSQVDQFIAGVDDGNRYGAFTVMAGFYYGSMRPEMAARHLREWNQKNRPPWDAAELEEHIRRFADKISSGQMQGFKEEPTKEEVSQAVEQSIAPFSTDVDKYLEELSKRGTFSKPEFPTGFACLDQATRGFARNNIYMVGAPTGGGKTQFALAAIHALIKEGKKVLYFSTEMPQEEIRDRFNAIGANIPLDELRTGRLSEESRVKLVGYFQAHAQEHANFIISKEDTPSLVAIRIAVESVKPDILVLDHIHHIKTLGDNRRTEIDDFIMGIKKLILEKDIPAIITGQLHRKQADLKGNIEYTEHDFKETGGIENEAGVCLLLCPPAEWTTERLQNTTFSVRKNRHGRKYQKFSVRFDTLTASFKEGL